VGEQIPHCPDIARFHIQELQDGKCDSREALEVKEKFLNLPDIARFHFQDLQDGKYELRDMTSKPSGFQFWENPAEDIYQDYFEKIRNANG
jgi:hypothetical protein